MENVLLNDDTGRRIALVEACGRNSAPDGESGKASLLYRAHEKNSSDELNGKNMSSEWFNLRTILSDNINRRITVFWKMNEKLFQYRATKNETIHLRNF